MNYMWITKNDLNKTRVSEEQLKKAYEKTPEVVFEEPDMVEHNGILIVDGGYLKALFKDIETIYTTFMKTNKKVYDRDGALTGIGLTLRDCAKIYKNNCESFESTILIPYSTDDLKIVIEHFLEVYPKEIIDFFEEKIFLTCSLIDDDADFEFLPKLSVPKELENTDTNGKYVLINMMVSKLDAVVNRGYFKILLNKDFGVI